MKKQGLIVIAIESGFTVELRVYLWEDAHGGIMETTSYEHR